MAEKEIDWRTFSQEKLAAIEERRAKSRAENEGKERDPKGNYKKVCPACDKPNALEVNFCTGCSFGLTEWDIQRLPDNIFLEIIKGTYTGTKVHYKDDKIFVFDDKYGVSEDHLDIIPTEVIEDITSLSAEHIPMLNDLYTYGLNELKRRNLKRFEGKNLEDYVVAGYNYPVSVKHLHLHMVLPPFRHEKVFQYPRWHLHAKVVRDLKQHGKVLTQDIHPNEEEGLRAYEKAIADSRYFQSLAAAAAAPAATPETSSSS
jgi:diadenosine tetraphosphate (Ap4A) HIT family hydrolase